MRRSLRPVARCAGSGTGFGPITQADYRLSLRHRPLTGQDTPDRASLYERPCDAHRCTAATAWLQRASWTRRNALYDHRGCSICRSKRCARRSSAMADDLTKQTFSGATATTLTRCSLKNCRGDDGFRNCQDVRRRVDSITGESKLWIPKEELVRAQALGRQSV